MPCFSERFSVKGRAEKCKNEGICAQNMSDLITVVTTPDGNMISLVVQQGDCNAPATHQALMNHLFSSFIGRIVDIYLDDIVIYSDTLDDHIRHVKLVADILYREKLYLSRNKLQFITLELKLLGRIIDDTMGSLNIGRPPSVGQSQAVTTVL